MMKHVNIHLIGLVFLFLVNNGQSFAQNIKIVPQNSDLGFVPPGHELNVHVTVTNTSKTNALEISNVKTSCQCTIATIKKKKLQPGEATDMILLITTKQSAGHLSSGVAITWSGDNGKTSEISIVSVTAQVVSIAELVPNVIDLGIRHLTDKTITNIVNVNRGTRDQGWTTFKIEHPQEVLPVTTTPYTDNGKWLVKAEVDPSQLKIGKFRQVLLFKFYKNDEFIKEVKQVSVTADIVGDIYAEPDSIYTGVLQASEKISPYYIKIRPNTPQKLTPLSADVSNPKLLDIKFIDKKDADLTYALVIKPKPGSKDINENVSITVGVESGKSETVLVPIVGFIGP